MSCSCGNAGRRVFLILARKASFRNGVFHCNAGKTIVVRRALNTEAHLALLQSLQRQRFYGSRGPLLIVPVRRLGLVPRLVRTMLKIRYIVVASFVGGGVAFTQMLDSWKEKIPDMSWLRELAPDSEAWSWAVATYDDLNDKLCVYLDRMDTRGWLADRFGRAGDWLNATAASGIGAVFTDGLLQFNGIMDWDTGAKIPTMPDVSRDVMYALTGVDFSDSTGSDESKDLNHDRILKLQEEIMQMQSKYQKELERLEKENKELRRQAMLKSAKQLGKKLKTKKSLIDMYSEVLDQLIDYDSSYSTQDHLPRVVVVGDQSSGKTSVLEMIAKARIFPRGSGEMMTRAPVKVTLSEGPYHIAQFKDSQREFDLTKESELAELRREIEIRMKNSVQDGKTVSNEVISLTVKGPGLPRTVLVDLPGIISTVTTDMAKDTKDDIIKICRTYLENPNAIILCIQDGSVDAERSNVTDLVSNMDPQGRRTILVLTKIDMAEENLMNPERIRKILDGQLFPMKALGYFAVVTGRGNSTDSIEAIRKYEEDFFKQSKLFRDGILKPSQIKTQTMSLAVSDVFWKMVKGSIEQQADAFKATRFNLETEWKNNFPRQRELDRDELFEKARGEVLDEIVNLSQITSQQWEESLQKRLWERVNNYLFENVYIPATTAESTGEFNTLIDIKLKHWTENLPHKCVDVGWETVKSEFLKIVEQDTKSKDHDTIFDPLKMAVLDQAMKDHAWDKKAADYLRVIQLNAVEDRSVPDKASWDASLKFMEGVVRERLNYTQKLIADMKGPSWSEQWLQWKYPTEAQRQRCAAENELKRLLYRDPTHKPTLANDEMTMVRKTLQQNGVEVDLEHIREVWHQVYRLHFLQRALTATHNCRNFFFHYQKGFADTEMDCNAVVLFWRVQKMLQATSNSLRQQITNTEARRLEKEIKDVLEDWSQDPVVKKKLLVGRRVALSEELKQVRIIQERLEEFIQSLNNEKVLS